MKNLARKLTHAIHLANQSVLAILVTIGLAMCCTSALSQSGAGSIQGTVTDSTGAVIPNVAIHVVNLATNVASDTKSNKVGFYQVPDLFTGDYAVTFTAPGFKTYTAKLELLVAQDGVISPVMTAGAVTQQITVASTAAQLVTTDSGTITSTLENSRIDQLPMNQRSLLALTGESTPGLESSGGGLGTGGNQTLDGFGAEALEYMVDGATTTDVLNGGEAAGALEEMIDPDAVQEVSIQLDDAGAQYATPGTGIITTKSGTNGLHGSFFETSRNNGLGIAKSRQNPATYAAPHYVRNEFGASAGGPIILPHVYHGKDKSFWFFAYERYSLADSSSSSAKVPTVAMSQGDFSGLVNGAGVVQQLYDPASTVANAACPTPATVSGVEIWNAGPTVNNPYCRTPFGNGIGNSPANNQIPLGEISPTSKVYYQLINKPTSTANPLVANNLNLSLPAYQVVPQMTIRADHVFNENNRAYLRYTQDINAVNTSESAVSLAADGIPVGGAAGYQNLPTWSHLASVGYTHLFSPTFFSETIASQQWFNFSETFGVAPLVDYESLLGLPNNFGEGGFPALGNATLISNLTGDQNGVESVQIISILDENLTKVMGRNQMQFGGRYRHDRVMDHPQATPDAISFSNLSTALYNTASAANYTALPNTGYADASMFLGSPSLYSVTLEPAKSHYHIMEFDGYFQDNYHLSKNLTVNLGARYEAHPAIWYKYGIFNTFDLKNDAMVFNVPLATLIAEGYTTQAIITNDENIGVKFETPAEAGMPNSLLRSYDFNFLPRVGISYQPFGGRYGTVIRGGYGRYISPSGFAGWSNQVIKNNPLTAAYSQSYTLANQATDALPDELLRYNAPAKFGVMGVNQANAVNSSTATSILPGVALQSISPNWAPETETQTNFTIEQALKGNSALRVSWVWAHSTNLQNIIHSYNNHPTLFEWEMDTGTVAPTGTTIGSPTYAATAQGPYDQTTWGANTMKDATGWSNYNGLQVNYQRLFHHGSAYQITYVYDKALETPGGTTAYPDANFLGALPLMGKLNSPYGTMGFTGAPPPVRPANLPSWANWHALDHYEIYEQDSGTPPMHVRFNGIIDLPFGRGKKFLGNVNRLADELVGGFQLAGDGQVTSQLFQGTSYYGATAPLKFYKHSVPITDCRSGNCYKAYMWFNGYLEPSVTQGVSGSTCTTNCVTGLPADYQPYSTPIDNTPGTTYYATNEVTVTLNNGSVVSLPYDAGPAGATYLGKKYFRGPNNWTANLSLFKVFPITERLNLRFNMDVFNAFNIQGYANPAAGGVEQVQSGVGQASSYWQPRQIQLTIRLTF